MERLPGSWHTRQKEREIWKVTNVTKEDFETTEGTSGDLYDKLISGDGGVEGHMTRRKRMT